MARRSFEDVLGTNYVPTPGERYTITTLVQKMEADLTSLEETISSLLEKREKLEDNMFAHKALLTPARRLLPELVSEVFAHSTPSGFKHWEVGLDGEEYECEPCNFSHPLVSETPLILGRICRRWRQIAYSTPSLWAAIRIPDQWKIEVLQEWISRAGSCPLSFSVALSPEDVKILNLLATHQQRWKDIVLRCDDYDIGFMKQFVESLSPCYSNLQTADLRRWNSGQRRADNGTSRGVIRLTIESAPNLTHLVLGTPIIQVVIPDRSPPLCLRTISIDSRSITIAELLSLLRLSPAVESVYAKI
ncbi:hypothetical protein BD410DRAFT_614300 [Rickenella mellea]|uniref:F-box domain-containing protein n=1 Tax=Rickenella mellea TaxID=50990 RepID=A0A4Y7PNA5_9AGAM|nr:hypothetical protein BD410DRAFT_614300 [Rickenella mellea]